MVAVEDAMTLSEDSGLICATAGINDHTLDENLPPIRLSHFKPILRPAEHDIGSLDRLPAELLHEVLRQLDVQTLLDLCLVNRRAA